MKLSHPILLLAFLCSVAFAEEKKIDRRKSVYLHPFTLATGATLKDLPLTFYLTGEFPLSRYNSFILNPSLYLGGDDKYLRIGSGAGMRRFTNPRSSGLYFQLMPSAHYMKMEKKIIFMDEQIGTKISSGILADVLGYVGYSAKFSTIRMFCDLGMGYGLTNNTELVSNGLVIDANIGIGLPF
jgi:hypothetical protein